MAVVCGQEITASTTLDADLTCDSGPALIIAADNIVVDLAGHTISGNPKSVTDTAGILFRKVTGSTVRNGTVQHFAAGVAIQGGGRNVVQNITAQDNIGPDQGNFGDGIVVDTSVENHIVGNTVLRNGPYSGITLLGASTHNVVRHNIVSDNNMLQSGDPSNGRQDIGIRIEGPAASHNLVESNTVTGSGFSGITLMPACADPSTTPPCAGSPPNEHNRILNNISNANGTSGSGSGDGIKVFTMGPSAPAIHNTVADNRANNNTESGVCADEGSSDNTFVRNSGYGNAQIDGYDGNTSPGDPSNEWHDNDFGTVNQSNVHSGTIPTPIPTPSPTPAPAPAKTKLDQADFSSWFTRGKRA
jgi:parallel beta-helix repeat protein